MMALNREHFKIIVFVGSNQTKVTLEIASVLQQMGERAEYIQISGNGPNALDFHIAYYLGSLATKEPDAYLHIVSKDRGFDPLINHLKTKKIFACRSEDVADIPIVKASNSNSPSEKTAAIVADLKRRGTAKPRTVKTLTSTISSMFQKQLPEQELESLLNALREQGLITITGTKVSYSLSA